MSLLDIVILVLVVLSMVAGYRSGMVRCIFSLLGLVAGIVFASRNYEQFAAQWSPQMHSRALADAMWFCILAIAIMVLAALLGWLIRGAVKFAGLGWLDQFLGLLFGFLRGAVLVTLCLLTLAAFYPGSEWMSSSRLAKYFLGVTRAATQMTTEELKHRILEGLQTVQADAPEWLHGK
jgi:membrane protein required for colicin V production